MNKNMLTFIACDCEYAEAETVIFGVPFDGTTSYRPGARFASHAIRSESYGLETYSPYQDDDLADHKVFDAGDIEVPSGNPHKCIEQVQAFVSELLNDQKIPFMIGGEHLVTLGSVTAIHERYPQLHVLHFDAHSDLRDHYQGEKLSHATVMRRVWEKVGDGRIFQFGIRSGEREEFIWAKEHVFTQKLNLDGFQGISESLHDMPVYVSLDLDVLDPSVFPGTGTPEAGGIDFNTLLKAVLLLKELKFNIVGIDVTELAPSLDQSGASTAVACKLIRELLLVLSRQ